MKRRTFLHTGMGFVTAAAASSGFISGLSAGEKKIPVGLQIYSVRDLAAKDLPGTLRKVAAIGYKGIEFYNFFGHTATEIRQMLDENGLQAQSNYVTLKAMTGEEFDKTIAACKILGSKYVIIGSGLAGVSSMDASNQMAAYLFDEISRKAEQHGMMVGYHAHGNDFGIVEGKNKTGWDLFFERTRKEVLMQMDVGNCLNGGTDPYKPLEKFKGRSVVIHLKPGGPSGTPLGDPADMVDWKRVFNICETTGGTQWYIVEQSPAKGGDSLALVDACYQNLKKLGKV